MRQLYVTGTYSSGDTAANTWSKQPSSLMSSGSSSDQGKGLFTTGETGVAEDAVALQIILLQEPKIDCRWVSGQFSESSSKGKGECGLIKATFPYRTKCINSCELSHPPPNTAQSFRNLTKGPVVSWRFPTEQTKACCLGEGIREPSSITGKPRYTEQYPKERNYTPRSQPPKLWLGKLVDPGLPLSWTPRSQKRSPHLVSLKADHCDRFSLIGGTKRNPWELKNSADGKFYMILPSKKKKSVRKKLF